MARQHTYEKRRPLSESVIWRWQRAYYERTGVEAWSTGTVPWFITSNTFIARSYARVALAYVQDRLAAGELDTSEPVHVVELGAGHGRFAFLLLRRLLELAERLPLPGLRFRYVATDVAGSNLDFLAGHAQLRPYLDDGVLDLARFDCERDTELELRISGQRLVPGGVANPMIVVANYVFDTLVQDAYRVQDGELQEGLVTVYAEEAEPDWDDPAVIERVKLAYDHVPVAPGRYPDRALDAILDGYARELANTSFPFPVGAFACLRSLRALSGDRLLLLSADKGYTEPAELLQHTDPQPVAHGSFSLSVNYHAIGQYVRREGGTALHTTPRDASLCAAAFVLGGRGGHAATTYAFEEHVEGFGPIDFFSLQDAMLELSGDLPLRAVLSVVRMSDCDPRLFYHLSDAVLATVDDATDEQKAELRDLMPRVWSNYLPLGEAQDLPFEIARIFGRMDRHRDALRFYEHSLELFGEDRATFHNMGMAHHGLDELDRALECFDRALELDPSFSSARSWRMRLQRELGR